MIRWVVFLALSMLFLLGACSARQATIVGHWQAQRDDRILDIEFFSDGTCVIQDSDKPQARVNTAEWSLSSDGRVKISFRGWGVSYVGQLEDERLVMEDIFGKGEPASFAKKK